MFLPSLGVLTLNGSDSTANYETVLRSATYENTSDTPSTQPRTLSMFVDDGLFQSNTASRILDITSVNDTPQINVPSGLSTDEDTSLVIGGLNAISLSDLDADGADIVVTLSVGNGTLSVSGNGSLTSINGDGGDETPLVLQGAVDQINLALDGLTYFPDPDFSGNDTLNVGVDDLGSSGGSPQFAFESINIQVDAINDAPTVTVPGAQSTTEDTPVLINGVFVNDVDAGNQPVSVTLSVFNGSLTINPFVAGGIGAADVSGNMTASVELFGTIDAINTTLADGISYLGGRDFAGVDSLTVSINDLGNTGNGPGGLMATNAVSILVSAVNDVPVVSGISNTAINFTENDGPTALAEAAAVSDGDNLNLVSATVAISNNFVPGEDVLTADSSGTSININFNSTSGVLTLSGIDSVANYQQVLRSVRFRNDSEAPSQLTRTVSVVVNDGVADSLVVNRNINVTSVNDAPTFPTQNTVFTQIEQASNGTVITTVTVADVDSASADLSFAIIGGNFGDAFAINPVTGEITVANSAELDFESFSSFDLDVEVTDSKPINPTPLTATLTITVNLTDIAEPFMLDGNAFASGSVRLVLSDGMLRAVDRFDEDVVPPAMFGNVTSLEITGRDNASDTLIIDFSGGSVLPTGGAFTYEGGGGTGIDTLELTAGAFTSITHTFANANDGAIDLDGAIVTYTGLEPVIDDLHSTHRVFTFSSANDEIELLDDDIFANGFSRIRSNGTSESVDFRHPTDSLTVDAGDGADQITIDYLDGEFGAPVIILGGDGDDTLFFTAGEFSDATGSLPPGLIFDGGNGFDAADFTQGIDQDGLNGFLDVTAEEIRVAGTLEIIDDTLSFTGPVTMFGDTVLIADRIDLSDSLQADEGDGFGASFSATGLTHISGQVQFSGDATFNSVTFLADGLSTIADTTVRFQNAVTIDGTSQLAGTVEFLGNATLLRGSVEISGTVSSPNSVLRLQDDVFLNGGTINAPAGLVFGQPVSVIEPIVSRTFASEGGSVLATDFVLLPGAVLDPGPVNNQLNTNNIEFRAGSQFNVAIAGAVPGTQFDQLNVTGTVNLTSAELVTSLSALPTPGQSYVIVNNDGSDPVTGRFAGLPEGTVFDAPFNDRMGGAGTRSLSITYFGGDGNDVELRPTANVQPGLVWDDVNENGLRDNGEPLLQNVTVQLIRATGALVSTTTTDVNGRYQFSNIAPG